MDIKLVNKLHSLFEDLFKPVSAEEKEERVAIKQREQAIRHQIDKRRVAISELPPVLLKYAQQLTDAGVEWQYGEKWVMPNMPTDSYIVRTANAIFGKYKGVAISLGSKIDVGKSSAGAWSEIDGRYATAGMYKVAVERLLKFMKKVV